MYNSLFLTNEFVALSDQQSLFGWQTTCYIASAQQMLCNKPGGKEKNNAWHIMARNINQP